MTPSIDQTLHQFANLLPNLTFIPILTLLPNFGGFHRTLQRVRLANRGRLLIWTPGPLPFGTCICSYVEIILSWTCHIYGPFEFRTSLGTSILLPTVRFEPCSANEVNALTIALLDLISIDNLKVVRILRLLCAIKMHLYVGHQISSATGLITWKRKIDHSSNIVIYLLQHLCCFMLCFHLSSTLAILVAKQPTIPCNTITCLAISPCFK